MYLFFFVDTGEATENFFLEDVHGLQPQEPQALINKRALGWRSVLWPVSSSLVVANEL